ncbi:MAG: choice-of-anchor D domain-containing protein, partial [Balneolia bacterium]|nr:choice-of-anchor D domain-containing protein [Balneolia bacterium]
MKNTVTSIKKRFLGLFLLLPLIIAGFSTPALSQDITILNEELRDGNLPAGWSEVEIDFRTGAGGYALFEQDISILQTPVLDLSDFEEVILTFDVAKFGQGADGPLTVQVSNDGGATWTAQEFDSPVPVDATYLTSEETITVSGENVVIRWIRDSSPSQKRLRDITLVGVGEEDPDAIGAFSLLSPPNNFRLPVFEGDNTEVVIEWEAADNADTYTWVANFPGEGFEEPLLALAADNDGAATTLTLTSGAIYDVLAGLDVDEGSSVALQWTVIAENDEDDARQATQTWTINLVAPIVVADIQALRGGTTDGAIYAVTTEATFIGGTSFRNTKFFQDASGFGIQVDDSPGRVQSYEIGENVDLIVGNLNPFQGQIQLVAYSDFGPAVSAGNVIEPVVRTLDELTQDDQSILIVINEIEFESAGGTFGGGGSITNITDPSIEGFEGTFRNVFGDSDITGSTIPEVAVNITGIVQENSAGLNMSARNLADIVPAVEPENPILVVNPTSLDFGTIPVGDFAELDFTITNSGVGTMAGEVESDNELFVGDFEPFSLEAGESAVYTVIYNPGDTPGEHTGTITVTAEGADGSPATVSLSGAATGAPSASVNPESISFSALVGEEVTRTLTISNSGSPDLEFSLSFDYSAEANRTRGIDATNFLYEKNGQVQRITTGSMKAPLAAGRAFTDGVISFEAGEGFEPGFIGGQMGWSTISNNTTKPVVSPERATDGDWSLELSRHDGLNNGATVGAFSPLFLVDEDAMTFTYDVFVEATGGSDYDILIQSPAQELLTARVKFHFQGNVRLVDLNDEGTAVFIDTGEQFPVNEWFELTIDVDRPSETIFYYINGDLIWEGEMFGADIVEQTVLLHDNWNDGEAGFVDNIRVSSESAGWISADITSGVVAGGESQEITLSFDTELEADTYMANVVVNTNDPENPSVLVPVEMTLTAPVEVASIAELFEVSEPGDGVTYTLTNEVYLVFTSDFRGRKVVVDGTGGVLIDDPGAGFLSKEYNRYDGITGLTFTVGIFGDTVQLLPVADAGDATSEDNLVIPRKAVISDLGIADQSELVIIEDVTFNEQGEFANQTTYTVVDGAGNELAVRTDRIVESILMDDEETYIGTPIPTEPVTVVGYISLFQGNPQLVIRKLGDFYDPAAIATFDLVSPPNDAEVPLVPGSDSQVSVSWADAQGVGVEYLWFANVTGLPLMVPALGIETEGPGFSVTQGELVSIIESLFGEVNTGDSFTLDWAVLAGNDTGLRHSNQVWAVTFTIAEEDVASEMITFQVDMTVQQEEGVFNPSLGDEVYVRGSFNDWSVIEGDEMVDNGEGV